MGSIEDSIRQSVRDEVRAVVREEIRAALAELRPTSAPAGALLTVDQVAERAGGVTPETVRDWIRSGRLAARRAGHRFLVEPRALEACLAGVRAVPEKSEMGADEHLSLLIDRIGHKRSKR